MKQRNKPTDQLSHRDPENLSVDTIVILSFHILSVQGSKKWNFGNGRANLHITRNAQGCQGGSIQILDQHP